MSLIQCIFRTSFILLLSSIWPVKALALDDNPLVVSKVGTFKGLRASDGDYNMFLGVPYGKIDKKNPFGLSSPYPKLNETFEAFDDSQACPQKDGFNKTIFGTLDCLNLNIYVPTSASSNNRLPVLIFIYGGAFKFGSASRYTFGPRFLVKHDIILIVLNHRVGPYGFMCLGNPEIPGNQGIKDQLLALRWIKNNIEDFGGNSDRITLSGHSSGSISVDLQIYAPSEILFQQAILMSGTTLNPFLFDNQGNEKPLKLAEYMGFETNDVNKALSFLAAANTSDVMAAADNNNLLFKACVEKRFENIEPIVTDYPVNLLVPKVRNITILIGFNDDEEIKTYGKDDADLDGNNLFSKYIKAYFDFDNCTYDEMKTILKHFYFGDEEIDIKTRREITNLASDLQDGYPILRSLRRYFDSGAKTIFSYLFSYVGQRNYVKFNINVTIGGAAHGDEIGYLFDVMLFKSFMSEEDRHMIDTMTTLWANFVKYGYVLERPDMFRTRMELFIRDCCPYTAPYEFETCRAVPDNFTNPTPDKTELLPVKWDPVTRDRWNYMHIDSDLDMCTRPFHERMSFLDLFFKANEKHQIGYRSKAKDQTCDVRQL